MSQTSFTQLLDTLDRRANGRIEAHVPADWMQGRTTYGGLTAALSAESARAIAEHLPLRSMQVAFIGPVGGDVVVSPSVLRRGKNSLFVNVDVVGESGISARSIFAFGARRDSMLDFADLAMPDVPAPEDCVNFFTRERSGPHFARHFEMKLVEGDRPVTASKDKTIGLWMRHAGDDVAAIETSLLALGDAPPPAAFSMLAAPGPISSMTWTTEFLKEAITTQDGWFYARHTADSARNGYSSQSMMMWSRDGTPVMVGRQTIAIFG